MFVPALVSTTRRGAIRGDAVELIVMRGDAERKFMIDGKKLCEDHNSRLFGFEQMDSGLARQMLATGRRLFTTARGDTLRADAASGYALARELEFVSATIAQQPLTDLTGMLAFPMAVDQPQPYQDTYSYKKQTWTKGGRLSRNYSDIGTRGGIQVTKESSPVAPLLLHAGWGLDDIARAALGNIPLPALELQGAMRELGEAINTEIWFGDANEGTLGFFNQSGVTPVVVANGANASPLWSSKSADEIEADVMELINSQVNTTKGMNGLRFNRLIFGTAAYLKLTTTARSQVTGMTILEFVEQTCARFGATVSMHPELDQGAAGDAAWMAAYRADSAVLGRIMPVAPTFLPPDIESTRITQAIHAQTGGLSSRFPVATKIRYGM